MIRISKSDAIETWHLEHGKANALDLESVAAISSELARVRDGGTRGVLLTAEGRIFSAGVDLRRLARDGPAYAAEFVPAVNRMFRDLFEAPLPIVAAINGHAIAGGCILAAACDWRVMARAPGTIGLPETHVGVPFPVAALEIMRHVVGSANLQRLIYSGANFTPHEALPLNLVDEVVESPELLPTAERRLQELLKVPPLTYALTKRHIRADAIAAISRYSAELDQEIIRIWQQPETAAAIQRFIDERLK